MPGEIFETPDGRGWVVVENDTPLPDAVRVLDCLTASIGNVNDWRSA